MSFVRKKGNNLDELINIPTKAEERFIIYDPNSIRNQGPNIKEDIIRNPRQNILRYSCSTIHRMFR